MKRIVLLLSSFFILTLMVACTKTMRITPDMLYNNVRHLVEDQVGTNVKLLEVKDYNVDQFRLDIGLLILRNDDTMGVWSLIEEKFIVPMQKDVVISIVKDDVFGAYIYVDTLDGYTTVYNILGSIIVDTDRYQHLKVYGIKEEDETYEYIEYRKLSNGDNNETKKLMYRINGKTKERIQVPVSIGYQQGELYDNIEYSEYIDLKDYGLKNYYAYKLGKVLYIYNRKTNSLKNIIKLPNHDKYVLMNGKLFYQDSYLLDSFSDEYDYIYIGGKNKLFTTVVDLLTGKEKQLKVDYVIDSIFEFKDEDNQVKFAFGTINKIKSKILITDVPINVIINSEGKILKEIPNVHIKGLTALNKEYYISNGVIYTSTLDKLTELPKPYEIVPREELIVFAHNGNYGAINYDREVVIPFEYKLLNAESFFNGKVIGKTQNNKTVIIDINGSTYTIEDKEQLLEPGLLYSYQYNFNKNTYAVKIMNYNQENIASFETDSPNPIKYTISNAYYEYKLLVYAPNLYIGIY